MLAAVASSARGRPVDPHTLCFGEVGLAGEVRAVGGAELRLAEAKKLGFRRCVLPELSRAAAPRQTRARADRRARRRRRARSAPGRARREITRSSSRPMHPGIPAGLLDRRSQMDGYARALPSRYGRLGRDHRSTYSATDPKGPARNNSLVLAADASRLASLLVGHIPRACSLPRLAVAVRAPRPRSPIDLFRDRP